ncbi:MAG TPA: hypothetical protein VFO60_06075, partial [Candidatus Dormibacteraeota bacterium]|nr:hypothetical protein [Candidatus Dormibacteraeota bacterium]
CQLEMLRDEDPQYTVQVTCAACHIRFVVVLQVRDRLHDEATEARRAAPVGPPPTPPIAPDELLDVHELLRDHRGSLLELLDPARARA